MEKGARVTITGGRQGVGQSGTVFWKGPNNWGEGERLGVKGDDGETYWLSDDSVEAATGPAPVLEAGPTFAKGDRVAFKQGANEGTGVVFWIGESRQGPGQRLGVRDDAPEGDDDAVWIDSRFARPYNGEASSTPTAGGPSAPPAGDAPPEPPPADDAWQAPTGADDLPEGPPLDEGAIASWAPDDDEVGAVIPEDWAPGE